MLPYSCLELLRMIAPQQCLIKLMISVNSPEPEPNYWQDLVSKVQEINQRTRDQTIMPHIPGQKSIKKHKYSRFQVQEVWHRSQEQAQNLINRIKYIEIDRERHNRTLELTRKKYERMVEIREKSLKEKQEFKKRIAEMNEGLMKEAAERVTKMKEDRSRTSHSVYRVRQKNGLQAKQIRDLSDEFDEAIRQQRVLEVQQKKMQVEKTKQMMEKSRMRLGRMQQQRIKLGKIQHKESIRKQLEINLKQHRRNSLLRNKLEQSITIANSSKQEKLNLLQEYQSLMAPHSSRAKQISTTHRSD